MQMRFANVLTYTINPTLEDREISVKRVGVRIVPDIFFRGVIAPRDGLRPEKRLIHDHAHQGGYLGLASIKSPDFLMPRSMNDRLPERHVARFIVEVVEGLNLRG